MRHTKGNIQDYLTRTADSATTSQQGAYNASDDDSQAFCEYWVIDGDAVTPTYGDMYIPFYINSTSSISSIILSYWLRGTADGNDTKIYTADTYTTDSGSSFTDRTAAIETAIGHALAIANQELAIPMTAYFTNSGWKCIKISYDGDSNCTTQVLLDTTR